MPKFVIERDMPKVGELSLAQMQGAAGTSAATMREMGGIHWVQSYATDDRIYCVYMSPDEDNVRKHAEKSRLPANRISQVRSIVDATTGE